ncbi:hypothetical protein A2W70_05015 [Candidatus Curtissbacteria bacterium RIFCSPLOWO2_02_41_11]|uniref:HD domain-containing protein n=2 Tax=Candidatus Curtissiibacteriota TaxID=1752717 RepID=A0A1F5HRG5_9BACT|nr:MAG: Hdig domain protein [Candidatus Curtissbacteria bacterium GW2011_GWA2_41_24]OGE06778.1 MAG: hypothetical protein A2W70_05015 [Candidatus Curtissbacteria bacterium RIFCSPLOWO2_02_41_11]
MTKEEALKTLEDLKNSPNMVKHALACGFVMRTLCHHLSSQSSDLPSEALAKEESFDLDDWEIVGLLHDADYELTNKSLDLHTEETTKKLKETGADQTIIDAIRGHCDKAPRETQMAKAIYACDELTGLIVACALVQPDKKLKSVTVESVLKKFKDKSFARGASRDQIKTCETELNIPLEEFTSITLKAMQEKAGELGL